MQATAARVLGPKDGNAGFLGSIGVRFMIDGSESDERFSLVEHPMSPRALAAPLHRHNREDEYSFVLEGSVGALLGDEVVIGSPGDLIFKPRGPSRQTSSSARISACAASASPRCSSRSDALQIAPAGLAIPRPAMSGAEPCTGSKSPGRSEPGARFALAAIPMPPCIAAARSV